MKKITKEKIIAALQKFSSCEADSQGNIVYYLHVSGNSELVSDYADAEETFAAVLAAEAYKEYTLDYDWREDVENEENKYFMEVVDELYSSVHERQKKKGGDMKEKIRQIGEIIELADQMKGAYFYNSPGNRYARRSYEEKHSADMVEWEEGGNTYTAEFITECSCKNVYANGHYTKNGKKTNLTAIRNSYERLYKEYM